MRYHAQTTPWRLDMALNSSSIRKVQNSRVIGKFRQIFPFTLFPDELIIEDLRIIKVDNKGPWVDEILSIMATDIASVNSSTGPFLGHIHIVSLTGGPEIYVDKLLRSDVYRIRSMIEGLALASRENMRRNQPGSLPPVQNLPSFNQRPVN